MQRVEQRKMELGGAAQEALPFFVSRSKGLGAREIESIFTISMGIGWEDGSTLGALKDDMPQ